MQPAPSKKPRKRKATDVKAPAAPLVDRPVEQPAEQSPMPVETPAGPAGPPIPELDKPHVETSVVEPVQPSVEAPVVERVKVALEAPVEVPVEVPVPPPIEPPVGEQVKRPVATDGNLPRGDKAAPPLMPLPNVVPLRPPADFEDIYQQLHPNEDGNRPFLFMSAPPPLW